jgi:hypothetical protein
VRLDFRAEPASTHRLESAVPAEPSSEVVSAPVRPDLSSLPASKHTGTCTGWAWLNDTVSQADNIPALVPSHGRVLLRVTAVVPASRTSQGYVHGYGDAPFTYS